MLQLTVLVDNNTYIDHYYHGEPGLAYYLQDGDTRVLFDTGYSDLFITNAGKMDIDLRYLDYLVLSHGHCDHTWGLDPLIKLYAETELAERPLKKPRLVAHPLIFAQKRKKKDGNLGSMVSQETAAAWFSLALFNKPYDLTSKLIFLGSIPRNNDYENTSPLGKILVDYEKSYTAAIDVKSKPAPPVSDGTDNSGSYKKENSMWVDDFLPEDSALAYKSEKGLVIITGCSHAGICNIIEHAKNMCGDERVAAVIGGFHLQQAKEYQLQKTIEYFKLQKQKYGLLELYPSHCVDLQAKIALSKACPIREVGVGLRLKF